MTIPIRSISIALLLTVGITAPPARVQALPIQSVEAPVLLVTHEQVSKLEQPSLEPAESLSTAQAEPAAPAVSSSPVSGCGDNQYANYIYMKESGCKTTARNPSGCYGIGQACPASKIAHCGSDYACQNQFFTQYANSRYGGWAGAYQFWQQNHWW